MARTNKYTSLNFNDYYEKNNHNRSSSSSSSSSTTPSFNKTVLSNSRIHGNMLVLTRPSPKPIAPPPPRQPSPPPPTQPPDRFSIESDSISLRPLGRTGSASPSPLLLNHLTANVSPKTNKFVPPHLRPGFHGREEKPETETEKKSGFGTQSSFRQVEEGRPKSGGGYEAMNRPRSSGSNRPYSSG
ncbi:hypothetical protein L1987_38988 [Smallanthus sonchifolius]|uniref:Uncharacterized protein n=1 Tax=Smallanthus sonchifolius TaxID=185202 RepID=A0ACB9HLY8_9ASTR|nr:hypothetical protein L1987_38988 [Smallanthus sonchifolius]